MRSGHWTTFCATLAFAITGTLDAADPAALTERGQKLEAKYSHQLESLKTSLEKALPEVDAQKRAVYREARAEEKAAEASIQEAQQGLDEVKKWQGLVGHAKGKWIGGADKGIAEARKKLEKATTDAERDAATKDLEKWQQNRRDGEQALAERQAGLEKAKREEPALLEAREAGERALEEAKKSARDRVRQLGLDELLASDRLDPQLVRCVVMSEATPRGLAAYAGQGRKQERLLERLLADEDLMFQMLVADGARGGEYGRAMEIYSAIQKKSRKAKKGALQRLALAVALEHAVPMKQRNAEAATDAPEFVDPVKRYRHFERAFLDGELDPAFPELSVWDYRMVVNGEEPEEILTWGREMLRNYRPDHISTSDYRWRYVAAVRSDVRYGSQYNKFDKPQLQFFQNIIMNGGVCGRRAFFGRFILRAFGVPTTARPSRGHAALAHWTPDGWVVCLGGGWGVGWTKGRYKKDLDFLATTQAREAEEAFPEVKRAQWIGQIFGEKPVHGFVSGDPAFWHGVALYRQREIREETRAEALAAVGEDIGEANETREKVELAKVKRTSADMSVSVTRNGTITIPAVACSKPTKSTRKIIFMDSVLGGKQLHHGRTGRAEDFEYTIEVPEAGTYQISARVVTVSPDQSLRVSANGKTAVELALPFTVGMWGESEPVKIELAAGTNVLKCSRGGDNIRGLTIKDFRLKRR